MSSDRNILLIGHSHVNCVAVVARREAKLPWLHVINLRRLDTDVGIAKALRQATSGMEPAAVCLCLGGNFHNVVGTIEHPQPFAIGVADNGSVPQPSTARRHIPRALMRAAFLQRAYPDLIPVLFGLYPDAQRLLMTPPPPVADFDHIRAFPGMLADKISLGPAPSALRLELYALQTEVSQALADAHNAHLITPPPHVFDDAGFLAAKFVNTDPTHGNAAYGIEMARELSSALPVPA